MAVPAGFPDSITDNIVGSVGGFTTGGSGSGARPLSIDGSGFVNQATGGSGTVSITTTSSNDIVMFIYGTPGGTLTAISDTAGLVWNNRNDTNAFVRWAVTSSALTNDIITFSCTGAGFSNAYVFAVNGARTSSPFDPNVSLPNAAASGSSGFNTSITTTNPKTLGFGWYGSGAGSPNPGGAWIAINDHTHFSILEYQIFSSPQTALTVSASVGTNPAWYVDAFTQ